MWVEVRKPSRGPQQGGGKEPSRERGRDVIELTDTTDTVIKGEYCGWKTTVGQAMGDKRTGQNQPKLNKYEKKVKETCYFVS